MSVTNLTMGQELPSTEALESNMSMAIGKAMSSTEPLGKIGWFFYILNPKATTFQYEEEVPDYLNEAIPFFATFVILEWIICWAKGDAININVALNSQAHGLLMQVIKIAILGIEFVGYKWLYQYRVLELDWDSTFTWWFAAIIADFWLYWFHRLSHELNFIWAMHQTHHSSEDMNLATALRQHVFTDFFAAGFYPFVALLGVPLPALIVHKQFNTLFQFWVHTNLINKCGPLEWIFNTPSHHRVHHGSNKWCLDKNYGGVLIIWDRIFGTHQEELTDEPIVYGLVEQPQAFNIIWMQFFYFRLVFDKMSNMKTFGDKCRALFYGPGWVPGSPRLGDLSTLPDEWPQRPKYYPQLPLWLQGYILMHSGVLLLVNQVVVENIKVFSYLTGFLFMAFLCITIGTISAMYDGWWWAPLVEAIRCAALAAYIAVFPFTNILFIDYSLLIYMSLSSVIWIAQSTNILRVTLASLKEKEL